MVLLLNLSQSSIIDPSFFDPRSFPWINWLMLPWTWLDLLYVTTVLVRKNIGIRIVGDSDLLVCFMVTLSERKLTSNENSSPMEMIRVSTNIPKIWFVRLVLLVPSLLFKLFEFGAFNCDTHRYVQDNNWSYWNRFGFKVPLTLFFWQDWSSNKRAKSFTFHLNIFGYEAPSIIFILPISFTI